MVEPKPLKLLIFDTILNGHHSDYITYLADYWHTNKLPGQLFVVTPSGLSDSLPEAYKDSSISFIELSEQEIDAVHNASKISRSFAEWNLYLHYAGQIQPTHALLMYFDLFQLGVWIGRKSNCPVSGIYFRPSFHYTEATSLKENLVVFRKKWLLGRVLGSKTLSNLFCLDKSVVPTIQKISNSTRIIPLSDPVKNYIVSSQEVAELRLTLGIDSNRKVFLLFGYLDDRKGIEQVLEAIKSLSPEEKAQVTLVLAGPIEVNFLSAIESRISNLGGDAQIICSYQELKGATIQTYFELSDYVLTLYQKHVGMSSIVIRAAVSEKPLISSDFGYLGALVRKNNLGVTVNSESPAAISEAFQQALRGDIDHSLSSIRELAAQNTTQAFASQIFESIASTT
jgi:glycosyltransferase involved in cell wall biosynthesis